ncbi:whey acidic protein-like isoform X4 [Hyla sarda]|nr:whey acidic protein-like isoform X4 [Hyla sarda]XP_056419670.1 whey acidic protein-like isoform X4 [Hyla sarda]
MSTSPRVKAESSTAIRSVSGTPTARARTSAACTDKKNPCPVFNTTTCPAQFSGLSECHRDEQCPGAERCCCADCVRKCTITTRAKPGQCPVPKQRCPARIQRAQCEKDGNCRGIKKCCDVCGKKCVDPRREHSGFCPVSAEQASCSAPLDQVLCGLDADCGQKQKCCPSNNRMDCVDAVQVKSGECPASLAKCVSPSPPPLCRDDRECPGHKKCCTPLCRKECTDPIIDKPGKCPAVSALVTCPTPSPSPLCEMDSQCLGIQKCCDYGCRQQCTDPVFV